MFSETHRGEIVADVVRKNNFPIKLLAEKLNISRNTVYNKFKEQDLSYDLIVRIGDIIRHDFSLDFPEIKTTVGLDSRNQISELWHLEQKYTRLLEKYNKLLAFLMKLANDYNNESLKKDLDKFLNNPSAFISF
jgi:hypothetical protein